MIQDSKIDIRLNSPNPQTESYFCKYREYNECDFLCVFVCHGRTKAWCSNSQIRAKLNSHKNVKEMVQTEHIVR